MPSLEYDIRFIKAAGRALKDYLLADALYWTITATPPPGEREFNKLTIGGLLLSLRRVEAMGRKADIQEAHRQITQVVEQWKSAWQKKIKRESKTRIREWVRYLSGVKENPQEEAGYYKYEVRKRVILQLLAESSPQSGVTEDERVITTDFWLQSVLQASGFIWRPEISSGFPEETYWFLYGTLEVEKIKGGSGENFNS